MKKNKPVTVSIGIPAYNEEASIGALLHSLIGQKDTGFRIKEIIVVSDASSDSTVNISRAVYPSYSGLSRWLSGSKRIRGVYTRTFPSVSGIKDKRIKVMAGLKRRGKCFRLNQLFTYARGDILVLFDADILPKSHTCIQSICTPFVNNPRLCGSRHALPASTLTGIALNQLNEAFNLMRQKYRHGKNIYSFAAGITALKKEFYKSVTFPTGMQADDNFLYLTAKIRKFDHRYAPRTAVWYRNPQIVSDQLSQGARFLSTPSLLKHYFDPHLVNSEFTLPFIWRCRTFLYQITRHPLAYLWLKSLSIFCVIFSKRSTLAYSPYWKMASTSKRLI